MTTPKLDEEAIFKVARHVPAGDARRAYLEQVCTGDEHLRGRVQDLLRVEDEERSFLAAPVLGVTVDSVAVAESPGTAIGPYKLLEQIGEGGFGVVFLAEQTTPVRRKVALKVLKPGMDTRQVVARFEAERQALALMDHPNIARVFDGGATPTARPYFVMELVRGVAITDFCDQHQLTPRQRLELFVPVCQAVQHAHQKGVVHRDLKPSNVLVSRHDTTPVVKVIDFGVAKAPGQELTEKTLFTAFAQMVGTPLYMSPEQAGMSDLDVDTRSDIYSLGVLLYELLTGTTPVDKERLRSAGYDELRRIIREEEPARPSSRLSTLGAVAETVSTNRGSEPRKLTAVVKGELDWIVMKCLEKDRTRRYETASALAADLQRYLNNEQVQACPPTAGYRLRKFVRRNRGPVLAASVVFLALVGGTVGTAFGLAEARAQYRAAADAAEAERQAKETAEARAAETQAVLEFVETRIFAAARPEGDEGGLGRDVSLRRAVEGALAHVDSSFGDRPLIEARLRLTLGAAFLSLDEGDIAAGQSEKARTIYGRLLGPDHPDTLKAMAVLGDCYQRLGRHADALRLFEETLALRKARLGPDHPETLGTMTGLGSAYSGLGRHADALRVRQEALELQKGQLGPDHHRVLKSMNNLGNSYEVVGRNQEARQLREETYERMKVQLGPTHPDTLRAMGNLGGIYLALNRFTDALKLLEENLALRQTQLGPDHRETLIAMTDVATVYERVGRKQDALDLREKVLALVKAKVGPAHRDTLQAMGRLGISYMNLARPADALKLLEEALALGRPQFRPDDRDVRVITSNLDNAYRSLGREKDALDLRQRAVSTQKANLGPDHPETLLSVRELARSYHAFGRPAEARKLYEEVVAGQRARLGRDHPDTISTMTALARTLGPAEALRLNEEILTLQRARFGPDHTSTNGTMLELARCYRATGRDADAGPLMEEVVAFNRARLGPEATMTLLVSVETADFYTGIGREADAVRLLEDILPRIQANLGDAAIDFQLAGSCLLAYLRANSADPNLRDPARAVDLVQRWPHEPLARRVRGLAHYRAGDWKSAVEALGKSLEPDKNPYGYQFVLAMAHWRLGDRDQARKWYAKGVELLDKTPVPQPGGRRLRAEAAELLGVPTAGAPNSAAGHSRSEK